MADRNRAERLFEAALSRDAAARAEFLDGIEAMDPGLRMELEARLAARDEYDSLEATPPAGDPLPEKGAERATTIDIPTDAETPPTTGESTTARIGPYRVLRRLGEGGMGVVFEAEQEKPVRRRVALKLIKWGMDTRAVVARFESERQALALMNHPNIARVYDAGATKEGRPFFAMEHVQGIRITDYCDKHRLTIEERLRLLIQVCEGVQHAHQKGIIHRDIKPSNVLATVQDGKPVPKIIDFGVAKATSQRLTEYTVATELGQLVGTPEYMSPEQAEMTNLDIDTRTDVYSLGVLLYELLVGAQPFDARALREAGLVELQRKLREVEPPRPSTRVSSLGEASTPAAANRRVEIRTLGRQLKGDLDWITMKALEKDRTRRYSSPAELAADLKRYLRNEPVLASPPSTGYRLRKLARRHQAVVALGAVVVAALVALAATMVVQAHRVANERDRANREAQVANAALEFMTDLFEISDPGESRGNTVTAREILDKAAAEIEGTFEGQPEVQVRLMGTIGRVYERLGLYEPAESHLRAVLAIERKRLGPEHPDVATAIEDLAWLLQSAGEYEESERLYREALEINRKYQKDDPLRVAWGLSYLGNVLQNQGRYEAAVPLHLEALKMGRELLEPTDSSLPGLITNAANALAEIGDTSASEALYREVLEIFRRESDEQWVAFTMDNLAHVLHDKGDYEEAEQLYMDALAAIRRIHGGTHPEIAMTLERVAWFLADRGEDAVAEEMVREALEMNRRMLASSHPYRGDCLALLAELLRRKGRYGEAEAAVREAIGIYQEALKPGHPSLSQARGILGSILADLGRPEEAEPVLVSSFETLAKARNMYRRRSLTRLIDFYRRSGASDEVARYQALLRKIERAG